MERERTKSRPFRGGNTFRSKPNSEKYKKKPTWEKHQKESKEK